MTNAPASAATPIDNMGVTSHLDWLRFTVPYEYAIDEIFGNQSKWANPNAEEKSPRALPSYTHALHLGLGRMDWNPHRQSQRRMFTFSGSDLQKARDTDVSEKFLLMCATTYPSTITRLDFAVNVRGQRLNALWFSQQHKAGRSTTQARAYSVVSSRTGEGELEATTLYIGSRSSESFLRIYDKGRLEKPSEDWLRIELELKAQKARVVGKQMVLHGIHKVGCQAITDFCQFDSDDWRKALDGSANVSLEVGRKQTNWEAWLEDIVFPHFEKAVQADAANARERLNELYQRYKGIL